MPTRIWLIPGTFAPDSPWTLPGSALRDLILAEYGNTARVTTLKWSTRNSHLARFEAAQVLARQIQEDAASDPFTSVSLIGHSHGGNVALLEAVRLSQDVSSRLNTIICVNTPFLHCEPRLFRYGAFFKVSVCALVSCLLYFGLPWSFGGAIKLIGWLIALVRPNNQIAGTIGLFLLGPVATVFMLLARRSAERRGG